MTTNTKVTLAARPNGMPTLDDFKVVEEQLGELPPEHVLVKVDTLSVDAFIRTMLDDRDSFHGVTPIGGPVVALGVGQVMESNSDQLAVGDWVNGPMMAQSHAQLPAAMLQKISPADNIPPRTYLGVLGLTTGITAWVGMSVVGEVKAEQTVVVSGAAGAVGSVAAQVAKARGARVIGIAGGPEKGAYLVSTLGLDASIDYKKGNVRDDLKELAPYGVDLFFYNVGGD
ncbi:MAG: NADP-dependent oxidoreductase, partial [Pseudomonadales bacterium]